MPIISPLFIVFVPCGASTSGAEVLTSLIVQQDCKRHQANDQWEPSGFILTTLLGIAGAFAATYLGQAVGWYKPGEEAGFIGAVVGAIIILVIWGFIATSP